MCGIVGVLGELSSSIYKNDARKILNTIVQRGPDHESLWLNDGYCLGHTRLSIIGLTIDSNQPYTRDDSEWIMTFNGEIYNYMELRETLRKKGHMFESDSDTEVLYRGFCEFGTQFFSELRGMFAVAFYNPKSQNLVLARDYSGEKPLYYKITNDSVIFSSCITSIETCLSENLPTDEINIDRFLHYQFVPSHKSIFRDVLNLSPGTILEIFIPKLTVLETRIELPKSPEIGNKSRSLDLVKQAFRVAVERTLVADVPIAISLSGGLDSVSIAAQIRDIDDNLEVSSFTAGYEGNFDFDERRVARRVASDFGFKHYEIEIRKSDFIEDFPELILAMNSPVGDLAAYPQFRIAQEMNKHDFKVGILGIGGDELFWGYDWAIETIESIGQTFSGPRLSFKKNPSIKELLYQAKYNFYNKKYNASKPTPHGYPVFYELLGDFNSPFILKKNFLNKEIFCGDEYIYELFSRTDAVQSTEEQFQSLLSDSWLTCNSLSLADSLGMQNSVEYRLPFLDLNLVSLSRSLTKKSYSESKNKKIFREALGDLVPTYVQERAKSGFRFPSTLWLPELFSRYEFHLTNGQLVSRGFADTKKIQKLLRSSKHTWSKQFLLYKLLVLEFYLENHSKYKSNV